MNYSVNLSSGQTVEVVIGEAAQINVEQALNYIESGRVEITNYVNDWAKPEITNYTNEYAKPIVAEIVNQTTKPLIDDYLNTTTKPQIDEYVTDNVKPYADSAKDSAAKAKTSETNAKASELATASSAGVASAAAVTATEAKDYTAKVLTDDNLKTVGQDLQSADSNIKTVATNILNVNTVAKNIDNVREAVQSANDARLWAVGTITEKPEGSSKYWAEQAKNAVKTPDASETVKGIVRLATSDEVTAGTNDSAAITPLKLKQTIAQDLTNPSTDTIPSTKAVSDESSRIVSIMDTKVSKKLNVNAATIGEVTDLRTPKLNEGNTSMVYIDGYEVNSEDDINGCLIAPALNTNGRISNRLMARKKINGNNVYQGLTIGVNADGSLFTNLNKSRDNDSIVTTTSHGSNYVRFGNGLQICWGSVTVGDGSEVYQNLPQAFKDTNYIVTFGHQNLTNSTTDFYHPQLINGKKNTTNFTVYCRNAHDYHDAAVTWIAIGYWY